ncbi:NAD(P)/FAD-dependent oxidoreductase [Arthrobacter sp. TB 23]|uniref:NAD(P)/FAD-dependent oxidoreductase n=1 Tax=Arthrobacter sp. TB 23 TaxID=494419 RepID=UPI0002DD8918|nr:FAD-dependent oxidoreductase [Arthrobacter sp. TB 23]
MMRKRILIIGAGAAGSSAAQALHQSGTDLEVTVIGAENLAPYNRTTVNKGLLSGAVDLENIILPGMDLPGYAWQLGTNVTALDPSTRTVELENGATIEADAVLLATGAEPRALTAAVDDGARSRVLRLRSAADTQRLRALTIANLPGHVVIAGAGLIGTETAAVLLEAGCQVTLTDPSPLPMRNHLGHTIAQWVATAHRTAGVDFRPATTITEIRAADEALLVSLAVGNSLHAAVVLASLGVTPATGWLEGSGIPLQAGRRPGAILVDQDQRVEGLSGMYAAGDAAAVPGLDGKPARIEHWGAAISQGRSAAAAILRDLHGEPSEVGSTQPLIPPATASYSTYVHGTKLTILGSPANGVREQFILGNLDSPRFALAFFDAEDRITGAVGVGGARAVNQLRSAIARRAHAAELETEASFEPVGGPQ